jgi:hypothetical protein
MIRPLRQHHRRIVITLGLFLPLAFAAGIAARKPLPPANLLPPTLAAVPPLAEDLVWKRSGLFSNAPIEVRLLREKISGRFAVQFSAATDFLKPDLLVYWIARNPTFTDALPGNATLLGKFDSPVLQLPPDNLTNPGVLVLYSLADNEIVAVSKPLHFGDSTKR